MSCDVIKEVCIYKGDALHVGWKRADGGNLTGWTCYQQLRAEGARTLTTVDREIVVKNGEGTEFIDTLTPFETGLLRAGNYILAAELINPTTNEGGEVRLRLIVKEQWVVRP